QKSSGQKSPGQKSPGQKSPGQKSPGQKPKALKCTTFAAATSRSKTQPHSQRCSRSASVFAATIPHSGHVCEVPRGSTFTSSTPALAALGLAGRPTRRLGPSRAGRWVRKPHRSREVLGSDAVEVHAVPIQIDLVDDGAAPDLVAHGRKR